MLPFDRGVVGELTVTMEDVKKTVGFGRYWPRQAHGLETGAWTYDGLWMPPHAPEKGRKYPWGDKARSNLALGFDDGDWTTTQADILRPPTAEELEWARTHPTINVKGGPKGSLALDKSPYDALTGYRKPHVKADERMEIPGKRAVSVRTVADEVSETQDLSWIKSRRDPRTELKTTVSEVREHFIDPAATLQGGVPPEKHDRFLDQVGVFKSTGSSGPPGW